MLMQPRRKDVNNDCKEATVAVSETRKDYMTLSKPSEDYSRVGNIAAVASLPAVVPAQGQTVI